MAIRILSSGVAPKTYVAMRQGVEAALLKGQRLIERAKVRTYWETGRIIQEHLLLNEDRAAYGGQVVPRLARDLEVSDRLLYQCLQFARAYEILHERAEFTWAHYRALLQVADLEQRKQLAAEASKGDWTAARLEARVREVALLNEPGETTANGAATALSQARRLLTPKRGVPGIYRAVNVDGALVVDLGFACYFDLTEEQSDAVKEGDLVTLDGTSRVAVADGATKADLFNYRVEISRVVDGDTFWIKIYLRPRQWLRQKLRLRGLDCPEMSTDQGRVAKRFAEGLVTEATAVTINTTKPDKYDRYLADVFLEMKGEVEPVFLNNALLENGHAVRKDSWEFGDWGDALM